MPAKLDGHTLFNEKGCAHCHGPEAAGTDDAPTLNGVGKRMPPEGIRKQIVEGGKSMPAFGDALTPEETDTLIIWLRSLKPLRSPKPSPGPAAKHSSH